MEILLRDSTNSGKAGGGEDAVAMRQMEVDNIDNLLLMLLMLLLLRRQMKVHRHNHCHFVVALFIFDGVVAKFLNSTKFLGGSGQKV